MRTDGSSMVSGREGSPAILTLDGKSLPARGVVMALPRDLLGVEILTRASAGGPWTSQGFVPNRARGAQGRPSLAIVPAMGADSLTVVFSGHNETSVVGPSGGLRLVEDHRYRNFIERTDPGTLAFAPAGVSEYFA